MCELYGMFGLCKVNGVCDMLGGVFLGGEVCKVFGCVRCVTCKRCLGCERCVLSV